MRQIPSRRDLLKVMGAGAAAVSCLGWPGDSSADESTSGRRRKSCILLWMDGGPSQTETFDPKPEASAEIRGELAAIETSVPGVQISERFPQLSRWMQHAAILRGMSTAEADHDRARIYMHTGYQPGFGGVIYPGLGSTVSAELGNPEAPLPNFVVTGTPLNKHDVLRDPGYRGPTHQPLVLTDLSRGLENVTPGVAVQEFDRRVNLLNWLEQSFAQESKATAPEAHQAALAGALRLIRSGRREAFELDREPMSSRLAYGNCDFGRGCLLARRLIEADVPFVEVYLANWDSHSRSVADETKGLMSQVDAALSTLIRDLHERGRLDDTLIVWMGEFGRTPRINTTGGRDHYARAWSTLLVGGGVRGGQAIGRTDSQSATVVDRPVSGPDFMATVCRLLGIDGQQEIVTTNGRPIRLVDKGGRVIDELIS